MGLIVTIAIVTIAGHCALPSGVTDCIRHD